MAHVVRRHQHPPGAQGGIDEPPVGRGHQGVLKAVDDERRALNLGHQSLNDVAPNEF